MESVDTEISIHVRRHKNTVFFRAALQADKAQPVDIHRSQSTPGTLLHWKGMIWATLAWGDENAPFEKKMR